MKNNIRGKIKRFLESEDGRVSTKAPLALGVATGSILLAQAMLPSLAKADPTFEFRLTCLGNADCTAELGEVCAFWQVTHQPGPTTIFYSDCIVPP